MFRGVGHGSSIDLVIYVLTLNGNRHPLSTKIAFILQDLNSGCSPVCELRVPGQPIFCILKTALRLPSYYRGVTKSLRNIVTDINFGAVKLALNLPNISLFLLILSPSHESRFAKSPPQYIIRELKQRRRRRRRGQYLVKNEFIFYKRNSRLSRFVQYANGFKNVLKLNIYWRRSILNGNTKN